MHSRPGRTPTARTRLPAFPEACADTARWQRSQHGGGRGSRCHLWVPPLALRPRGQHTSAEPSRRRVNSSSSIPSTPRCHLGVKTTPRCSSEPPLHGILLCCAAGLSPAMAGLELCPGWTDRQPQEDGQMPTRRRRPQQSSGPLKAKLCTSHSSLGSRKAGGGRGCLKQNPFFAGQQKAWCLCKQPCYSNSSRRPLGSRGNRKTSGEWDLSTLCPGPAAQQCVYTGHGPRTAPLAPQPSSDSHASQHREVGSCRQEGRGTASPQSTTPPRAQGLKLRIWDVQSPI